MSSPSTSESMPIGSPDRIQLNAAIQQLIESKGFPDEARQAVYVFGVSLAAVSRVSGSVKMETPGDSVTLHPGTGQRSDRRRQRTGEEARIWGRKSSHRCLQDLAGEDPAGKVPNYHRPLLEAGSRYRVNGRNAASVLSRMRSRWRGMVWRAGYPDDL